MDMDGNRKDKRAVMRTQIGYSVELVQCVFA